MCFVYTSWSSQQEVYHSPLLKLFITSCNLKWNNKQSSNSELNRGLWSTRSSWLVQGINASMSRYLFMIFFKFWSHLPLRILLLFKLSVSVWSCRSVSTCRVKSMKKVAFPTFHGRLRNTVLPLLQGHPMRGLLLLWPQQWLKSCIYREKRTLFTPCHYNVCVCSGAR